MISLWEGGVGFRYHEIFFILEKAAWVLIYVFFFFIR